MFGNRRRRAASNPPQNASTVSSNAATAAAQAFLKNRASNASLSSAAAAAALRSRPTTPISVADVQTKRTIRRATSTSSNGSAGSGRPQLERRGSSGSMSERTFRDPSPARSSQPVPSAADAPPVPALPKSLRPAIPEKSHRRAASLETPMARVASPPPNMASGRGSSLGPRGPKQSRRGGQRNTGLSSVQEQGYERPASRGSVNFSLPTNLRPGSPVVAQRRLTYPAHQRAQSTVITSPTNQNLVYDPNTRSFLPRAEILAIEQRVQDASRAPVKKMHRVTPQQATGTHLADGTIGGRLKGTAVDEMEPSHIEAFRPRQASSPRPERIVDPVPLPRSFAEVPQKKQNERVVAEDPAETDQPWDIPDSSDTDSDYASQTTAFNTRPGVLLAKKPSIVREDREREEEEDDTPGKAKLQPHTYDAGPTTGRTTSPTPLPRSAAGRGHGRGQASASAAFAQGRQHTRSASQPAPALQVTLIAESEAPLAARGSVKGGRVQSVSPARTTHFAQAPEGLVVKHQPPARSISPRKSALKHSTPRGSSPGSNDFANGQEPYEAVDDASLPRKKANRVSFNETNVVVGQAAPSFATDSPVIASPQTKRSWFSIGRGKKKDQTTADDDDEVMKPRPALPSFGSVREKKPQPDTVLERPLMKPNSGEDQDIPPSPPSLFTSPTGELIEYPLGQSNDHIVGSILSQEAVAKNTANISKSREPLPPQVTSVEGNGYLSDTNSSVASNDEFNDPVTTTKPVQNGKAGTELIPTDMPQPAATRQEEIKFSDYMKSNGNADTATSLPNNSVRGATLTSEATEKKREWPNMPGGWADDNHQSVKKQSVLAHNVTEPIPSDVGIAEPTAKVVHPSFIETGNASHSVIVEETEDSDNTSIYSDAAEDFSDLEGDGFMSLDAVVESPIVPSSGRGIALTTPPESPTFRATKERAYTQHQLSRRESEPDADQGWGTAQEYWKGLSAEKKRQIEQEAQAAAEESEEEVVPDLKSTRKKKQPTTRATTQTAIALNTRAIPLQVPQIRQPVPNNERTYMIAPGTKQGQGTLPLRSSMRPDSAPAVGETHIRKSMRGEGSMRGSLRGSIEEDRPKRGSRGFAAPAEERPMRSSLRGNPAPVDQRSALQKKHRPMSHGPDKITPDPAAVNAMMKKLSASNATTVSTSQKRTTARADSTLRRRGSADSDSSFKRARTSTDNIPSFRSSMRGSRDEGPRRQSPAGSSRWSLRTMSPTGSTHRRPFSSSAAPPMPSPSQMRNSLRNAAGPTPTLREPARTKSPLRIPGFGGGNQSKQKPVRGARSSRFDDSSDEEDARPAFRSRFNDSSDEDDGPAPTPRASGFGAKTMRSNAPVRGIPKRGGVEDGDSSDLPDSDDEQSTSRPNKLSNSFAVTKTGVPPTKQSDTLASGSLRRSGSGRGTMNTVAANGLPTRPNNKSRGSFLSILRRKKDPESKVRKSEAESPARRDTPLERSRSDLATLKTASYPTSPRLQKRNPMDRQISGTGSIVPKISPMIAGGAEERPFTADPADDVTGAGSQDAAVWEGQRPDIMSRRHTATGLSWVDIKGGGEPFNGNGAVVQGKKKKKFQALRKMFKLDD